jgi:hypothetical protein
MAAGFTPIFKGLAKYRLDSHSNSIRFQIMQGMQDPDTSLESRNWPDCVEFKNFTSFV